jgi:hypothetical protein
MQLQFSENSTKKETKVVVLSWAHIKKRTHMQLQIVLLPSDAKKWMLSLWYVKGYNSSGITKKHNCIHNQRALKMLILSTKTGVLMMTTEKY